MKEFFDMLKHPPSWLLAILLVVMVAHLIHKALKLPPGGLLPILEFFVVVILGGLTAHSALTPIVVGQTNSLENTTVLVIILCCFTLMSLVLYLIDSRSPHS